MQEIFSKMSKKQKVIFIISIIIILSIIMIYIYTNNEKNNDILISNDINEITNIQEEERIGISSKKEIVIIHVIGEVNNPRSSRIRRR